jgi:hypothetical protein
VNRDRIAGTGNTSGYPATSYPEYGDLEQRPRNKTPILVVLAALLAASIQASTGTACNDAMRDKHETYTR